MFHVVTRQKSAILWQSARGTLHVGVVAPPVPVSEVDACLPHPPNVELSPPPPAFLPEVVEAPRRPPPRPPTDSSPCRLELERSSGLMRGLCTALRWPTTALRSNSASGYRPREKRSRSGWAKNGSRRIREEAVYEEQSSRRVPRGTEPERSATGKKTGHPGVHRQPRASSTGTDGARAEAGSRLRSQTRESAHLPLIPRLERQHRKGPPVGAHHENEANEVGLCVTGQRSSVARRGNCPHPQDSPQAEPY